MAAKTSVPGPGQFAELLGQASPDLLQVMVKLFAEALMSAEADAVCGAEYGQRSSARVNSRNGYRARAPATRAGTIGLAIPTLRKGSYFPIGWPSRAGGPSGPWSG